jgi:hypothetical protein
MSRGPGKMQRSILAVLEAHEQANQHRDSTAYRLMTTKGIAAAIFGAGHKLTPSESSSLRRALGKLYSDRRIGSLYWPGAMWTANRRWALQRWLEAVHSTGSYERQRVAVARAEAELAALSVAKHNDAETVLQNRNT